MYNYLSDRYFTIQNVTGKNEIVIHDKLFMLNFNTGA